LFREIYWAWEGVLDKEFCDYVLSKQDWDKAQDGLVRDGEGIFNEKVRITSVLWEELNSPITAVAFHYINMANELAGWDFDVKYPQKVQVGRYGIGGHYDWHLDIQPPVEGFQRKLSCSILLNDPSEYEGGDLEFRQGTKMPPKVRGTVIVFPSMLEHRVTPITSGTRYSAVCWAIGKAFK
jgi:PKHD-type hydroxylase